MNGLTKKVSRKNSLPELHSTNASSGVARNFSQGVRNSNCLHSPIFNRRSSLFLSRAEHLTAERVITCRTSSMET